MADRTLTAKQAADWLKEWWRTTLTSRVVAGALLVSFLLVTAVTGFLFFNRGAQADQAVRSEAATRATAAAQLFSHVTAPQTQALATNLAHAPALRSALAATDPAARSNEVAALFQLGSVVPVPGTRVAIFDDNGVPVYTNECGTDIAVEFCAARPGPHLGTSASSVSLAVAEGRRSACAPLPGGTPAAGCPNGYEGVEVLGGSLPAFDAAVPVWDQGNRYIGVVVASTTLQAQFHRLGAALVYTPALVTTSHPANLFRFDPAHDYALLHFSPPSAVAAAVDGQPSALTLEYASESAGDVAGSYLPVAGPDGNIAAYSGVEVPTSAFAAQTGTDQRTIILIGLTALVLIFVVVALLMPRFLLGPIARLEAGARRIADGDLSTDLPVTTDDDLARVAASVNRMRARIAEDAGRLDASVDRLDELGRALTATGAGVEALEDSVVDAARAIGGHGSRASLFVVDEDWLRCVVSAERGGLAALGRGEIARVLRGEHVHRERNGSDPPLLLMPMLLDGQVWGALAVWSRKPLSAREEHALAALANSAGAAIENTRAVDSEREAMQRLRDIDAVKTDFLVTTQEALRTPVEAILGEVSLIASAWEQLDAPTRLAFLQDLEGSARLLSEIVENMTAFVGITAEETATAVQPAGLPEGRDGTAAPPEFADEVGQAR